MLRATLTLLLTTAMTAAALAVPPAEQDPASGRPPASQLPTDPDLAPAPRLRDASPPAPPGDSPDRAATPVPPAASPTGPAAQSPRPAPPARPPAEAAANPQSDAERDNAPRNTERLVGPPATAPETPAPTIREPRD